MKFLNYSEKIERYNHSEINPPQLVRKMDFFLIGVITLSYSGILSFLPMGTFSHSWVERVFDIVVISYVCLRPKSFDSAQPILLPTVWMLFYFIFGYLLGENSDLVTNSMGKGILVYLPLLFFTGLAIRNQNQWARMAAVCQFVALGACAVILTQAVFPSVLDYTMASVESYSSSGIAFEHNRLSALWMNPNDAALCFSVTYVLSLWCRPEWLAWAGRLCRRYSFYCFPNWMAVNSDIYDRLHGDKLLARAIAINTDSKTLGYRCNWSRDLRISSQQFFTKR